MNTTEIRIKEATEKFNEWVEYLATRPDSDLVSRLEINHAQYAIAVKEKKEDTCRLLNIMERIIIEARIYKAENNVADIPSEIEQALAELELMEEKTEERKKVLAKHNKQSPPEPEIQVTEEENTRFESRPDPNDQLKLF